MSPRPREGEGAREDEGAAAGRALRRTVPRSALAEYTPPADRTAPVAALQAMSARWLPDLVPVRVARMTASPLGFLRGAAQVMAADLRGAPVTGVDVGALGDAHLLNFGGSASPERRLLFAASDFDEAFRGPWEGDVRRLAASAAVAGRELDGGGPAVAAEAALAAARGYREAMGRLTSLTAAEVFADVVPIAAAGELVPGLDEQASRWHVHTSAWERPRLTGSGTGRRITARPPLTERVDGTLEQALRSLPDRYAATLPADRRALLSRYATLDVARHAVGVGSLGTRCFVVLLQGRDGGDPLILQAKEARPTVPAAAGRAPRTRVHAGRRLVEAQQLGQAGADALLGWDTVDGVPVVVRQLRDMRGGVDLRTLGAGRLAAYVALCGGALARTHARSRPPAVLAGYLGHGDAFDKALAQFAARYADQTERDHAALVAAVRAGVLESA